MYLKVVRQHGFRTERGTEIRESQINPACAPTCLYVLRLHPVLIYPQVTRWLCPSMLFLTDPCTARNKKEAIHSLHSNGTTLPCIYKIILLSFKGLSDFFFKGGQWQGFLWTGYQHQQSLPGWHRMQPLTLAPSTALHGMHNGWHCQD